MLGSLNLETINNIKSTNNTFQMNIKSFLTTNITKKSNCTINMQIVIYNENYDKLILGQKIFDYYDVGFDYENQNIYFRDNPINPDKTLNVNMIAAFSTIMSLVLLVTAFMIYYTLYRKRKQKDHDALMEENEEENDQLVDGA